MADVLIDQNQETATASPLNVTERALQEIRSIREKNDIPADYGLRVGVKGGGCSGLSYTLAFDAEKRDDDKVLTYGDDLKLYVDKKSLFYLMGCEVDFTDGLNGRGFTFNNPNATKTCGCGSSFGV